MSIKKTVCCDICNEMYTEEKPNEGFPEWGQVTGITLNGVDNPYLCPMHLAMTADFINNLVEEDK